MHIRNKNKPKKRKNHKQIINLHYLLIHGTNIKLKKTAISTFFYSVEIETNEEENRSNESLINLLVKHIGTKLFAFFNQPNIRFLVTFYIMFGKEACYVNHVDGTCYEYFQDAFLNLKRKQVKALQELKEIDREFKFNAAVENIKLNASGWVYITKRGSSYVDLPKKIIPILDIQNNTDNLCVEFGV